MHFTINNTEGYTPAQLHELNRRITQILANSGMDLTDPDNMERYDWIRERVLTAYDSELAKQ